LSSAVHTGEKHLIGELVAGATRAGQQELDKALRRSVGDASTIQKVLGYLSSWRSQVDKAGREKGLTGLASLELRKFEDPDATKSARFKEVVMKWLTTLAAQFPVLTVILSVCFESNPSIHDEVLFPTFRASHFFAWASFGQRGLSASDVVDSLLVFENDVRVDAQFASQLDHALVTLRPKAENWDLCVFTRGGSAAKGSDEGERVVGRVGRTDKFVVYQAKYMAGTCAYLISKKGAAKLAHSGFYKDDFLNAINDWRVGAHMNDGHRHTRGDAVDAQRAAWPLATAGLG
jgi:hypothetical protein